MLVARLPRYVPASNPLMTTRNPSHSIDGTQPSHTTRTPVISESRIVALILTLVEGIDESTSHDSFTANHLHQWMKRSSGAKLRCRTNTPVPSGLPPALVLPSTVSQRPLLSARRMKPVCRNRGTGCTVGPQSRKMAPTSGTLNRRPFLTASSERLTQPATFASGQRSFRTA